MTALIISLALGAAVWLVLPPFLEGFFKRKSARKATATLCKIIGIAIMAFAVINFITGLIGD